MTTLDRAAVIEEMAEALRKCLYTKTGNAIAAENVHVFERAAKALEAYRAIPAQSVAEPAGPEIETLSDERLAAIRDNTDNGMASRVMAGELLIARSRLAAPSQQEGVTEVTGALVDVVAHALERSGFLPHLTWQGTCDLAAIALEAALVDRDRPTSGK